MDDAQALPRMVLPGFKDQVKHCRSGRPASTWLTSVDKDLGERGFSGVGRFSARRKAQNREGFRREVVYAEI